MGRSSLLLVFASTAVERRQLDVWLDQRRAAGRELLNVVPAGEARRLAAELAGADGEVAVVPVGVAWLPANRNVSAVSRWFNLLGVRTSGRPWAALQSSILRRDPDRCRVIVGDSASVASLRQRWLRGGWTDAGSEGLARFVVRQGELALERAERGLIGSRYKVASQVREEIRRSKAFWAGVDSLSERSGRRRDDIAEEALRYLDEMMTKQSRLGIDLFAQLERLLLRSYRVDIEPAVLDRLRELNRQHSLVFLPSHRSYLDPMVLGLKLQERRFPPNLVLGGVNLNFWPVGPLARRAGVVFIRRTIRDNEVYKLALRQYLAYLIEKRFNLEWYLEGGRSRTGKLRPPRFGLFAYLVQAFRQGRAEDIVLVPVSIVYDQLHEVREMVREARGATKPRESFRMLLGYARAQGRRFGAIHVRLGEPLSLREALQRNEDPRLEVERVAIEVSHRINEVTPVTPTSLVTMALLGVGNRALTLTEVRDILAPLLDYVTRRGLPVTEPGLLREEAGILDTLDELSRHGVVSRSTVGLEPVFAVGRDQHLVAAFYRNGAIHFFVNRAVGELALARLAEGDVPADPLAVAWAEALRLRDLLKFEFFFPRRSEYADQLRRELEILGPSEPAGQLTAVLSRARLHLAHRVLSSFMEAYWIVADRLAEHDPKDRVDDKELLAECLAAGRQYLLQARIQSPESVSVELFANALKLAANWGLIAPGDERLAEQRHVFRRELATVVGRLNLIGELAVRDLKLAADARVRGTERPGLQAE